VETNQGLSYARNRGIAEAKGEILVFLDDDAFIGKDYLKNLEKNLENSSDFAAFGGKITPKFESGVIPKWLSKWSMGWVSAIDLGEKTRLFKGNIFPIGANMGFSRTIINKVGNFNTALGRSKKNLLAGEEKDIFNRIKAENGGIYYFPNIEVQHVIPESRTTSEYLTKMGIGVGVSERIRTLSISKTAFFKRLLSEMVKWAASIVLFFRYLILFQSQKGTKLLQFRWNVTKGLLQKVK
jgi:GT2 family glycosyltransferase